MKLHIKNMVCDRCKMVVKSELNNLGLHYGPVELGEVEVMEDLSPEQIESLNTGLENSLNRNADFFKLVCPGNLSVCM